MMLNLVMANLPLKFNSLDARPHDLVHTPQQGIFRAQVCSLEPRIVQTFLLITSPTSSFKANLEPSNLLR